MSGPPPPPTLPEERTTRPPRKSKPEPANPLPPAWSILLTVFIVLLLAGCLIGTLVALGGNTVPTGGNEPVMIVISAVPSATLPLSELVGGPPSATPDLAVATPMPNQSIALTGPTLIPTPTITPTAIAIAVGATVIIKSQGGVNVRTTPGTDNPREFVGNVGETFLITDGPQEADDLRWWQIRDPFNSNRIGWVAENDGLSDLIAVFVP